MPPPEAESTALVMRLRRGENTAYEELLDLYEERLFRYLCANTHDADLAEECCAEAFARFVGAVMRFKGDDSRLRPFLFAIATNVMREHRRKVLPMEDVALLDPTVLPTDATARLDLDRILKALHQLSSPAREVVLLYFVEDLKLSEVAEALALPLNTVKSHIYRSRQHLRGLFKEYVSKGEDHG